MKTLFNVRNSTGETWPAYAMGRLGAVILRDGVNEDHPLYALIKPDGADGVYIVNGASPLADGDEGAGIHYLDAQRVSVKEDFVASLDDIIGASKDEWEAGKELYGQFVVLDEKNDRDVVPVVALSPLGRNLQAILQSDLYAAVNTKRDPSTAIARVLRRKVNGDLAITNIEKTVVNRFKNISMDAGMYIKIEPIDGEWQPYAADCPGDSSSSGSGSV